MTLFLKSSPVLFVFLLSLVFGPFDAKGNKKEWQIVRFTKAGAYQLQHVDDKKLAHAVQIESPGYRFEEARMVKGRPIVFLIYFAGSLGTYEIIDTYRAVILNTKSKKFLRRFSLSPCLFF